MKNASTFVLSDILSPATIQWNLKTANRDLGLEELVNAIPELAHQPESRQTLLKLAPQYQTRELCFLIGSDGTLGAATARMDASLPALLAVVNRSRTVFGDFDAVRRDDAAIQSRSTAMLWTKDAPYVVQVASTNDADGRPVEVTFSVADEQAIYTHGAERVSHRPAGQ